MKFLKYTLASLLAIFIFIGSFFLFFLIIGLSSGGEETRKITKEHLLELNLKKPIVEQGEESPFMELDIPIFSDAMPLGLNQILESIEYAKTDDKIKGIYLSSEFITAGMANTTEIRDALEDFKTSGKKIYAYAEFFTQKSYYLASVADHIAITPVGAMELKGLSTQVMFFKDFLAKFGVSPQIIRHGKFKSAVEPFMLDKMSEANLEQTKTFIDEIWNSIAARIAEKRKVSIEEVNAIAEDLKIQTAQDAKDFGMIDAVSYLSEFENQVKEDLSWKKFRTISIGKYRRTISKQYAKNKVAIIYAEGEIVSGKGTDGQMGSETIVEAIRDAKKDKTVKSVVLRVNSPGGSALASDVMWKELKELKEEKPIVVSMGDVAASGGYYISCMADKIYAQDNTITGSIGVFGLLFHIEDLMKNKLNIHVDQYKTHKYSDLGNMSRPLSEDEKNIIQKSVVNIYDDFITKVADGRKISKDSVDAIGQGRVWSGVHAKSIGLVDELGGIDEAVAEAARLADLESYGTKEFPEMKDPFEIFLNDMSQVMVKKAGLENLQIIDKTANSLIQMTQKDRIQARLPFEIKMY